MASYHLSPQPQDPFDGSSSSVFLPTVSIYDWWLIRRGKEIHGKTVAVAGFTSPLDEPVSQPVRMFKSAPIARIYNSSTLETADDVCVDIKGSMNVSRTAENGFSSEVCKKFESGFPVNWENLVAEQGNDSPTNKTSGEDIDSHVPDQVSQSKEDQNSPRGQKSQKENQPEIESQVPSPVSRSKMDQTSPGKENQLSTRTRRALFTENVAGDLSSDLPEDAMEEVRVDPLASALVKFESSSHHHIDQTTPGKKDQASPGNHKTARTPSQTGVGPSSAPPLVKPRRSSRRQIGDIHPLVKPRRSYRRQIGTLGKGDVRRQTRSHGLQKKGISPDSFKRSRSGRILLPPLAFWRNELPVYDADGNVAGVQGLDRAADSKDAGNKSRRK